MKIESRLVLSADYEQPLPVICTRVNRDGGAATVITTVIIGSTKDRYIAETAQECIDRFLAVHDKSYPDGLIYLVELSAVNDVDVLVAQSLGKVKSGDAIVYLCNQQQIYDRVILDLSLDIESVPALFH